MTRYITNEKFRDRLYRTYFIDQWIVDRANTNRKWSQGDEEYDYDPVDNLYGPDDITYNYNAHGFRCDPFENNNAEILFMGCSLTEGTGLPLKDLWSTHVHQALYPNTSYINLGIAGGGVEGQAESLQYFWNQTKRKVKDIVFWVPQYSRRFYKVNGQPPWTWLTQMDVIKDPYHNYSLELFMDEDYGIHQSMIAIGKIKLVAELMQANLHIYDQNTVEAVKKWYPDMHHISYFGEESPDFFMSVNDLTDAARDKKHIGPANSKLIAEYITKKIKEFYERQV